MYIYIYTYMYICIYLYTSIYIYIYLCVSCLTYMPYSTEKTRRPDGPSHHFGTEGALEDDRADIESIEQFEFDAVEFTYPARPEVKAWTSREMAVSGSWGPRGLCPGKKSPITTSCLQQGLIFEDSRTGAGETGKCHLCSQLRLLEFSRRHTAPPRLALECACACF